LEEGALAEFSADVDGVVQQACWLCLLR